ncbi:histone H3.v1-like protein isoform X2 [Tanacetum coccineum]
MEGGIVTDHAMLLDYVEFHIFPSNNRYDASVLSSNRKENVASGPLEQLSLHMPEIKNLSSKGFDTKFKVLPPENVDDAGWFTTTTLTRFLEIVGLPDVISIGKEISQLEETREFQLSLSNKVEADITTSTESKNELLVAVDLRLTALKEELAAALNRAIGSKCSPEDMCDLSNFALHFGSKNLRDSLQRSVELTTEDEDSANSSEEDQPSAERSRTLSRSTMPRRSASPMRRIQIGRSGSRRAAALSIKSLNYFPANKPASQRDAAGNSSEEEDSQRPPKNNVLKMSVQDKISLFESKQREQGVEINKTKTPSVTVGANKAVLRRWTSSIENISLVPEKQAPEQLGVEVNTAEPERDETCEKIPASIEWIQQKGAELNEMFTELMESKSVSHQNVASDSSKNKEQRGGFYDLYKKKREEKLQGEATRKKVAKDDDKKAKTATTKVSVSNRRRASANEPQKPQKNSNQLINSRTTKPSAVKKSTSKLSPSPPTRKSLPSTPSPQASVASPVRTPTRPSSTNSTPTNRKPHSASPVVRSSAKLENMQPRAKSVTPTKPDAKKRVKAINEKQATVTENRKMTKTKIQAPKSDATDTAKPSFYNKVTKKSSVVPLETKPFLRKGSRIGPGVGPVVIKSKVVAQPEETLNSSDDLIQPAEIKLVNTIDVTSQNQENESEISENRDSLDIEHKVVGPIKYEEPTAEPSEVNTTGGEELEISPTAWVVNEEPHEEEIVPLKESPIQLASPVNVASPVGYSHPRVRHSLSQMLLEDSNEADMDEWGNAEHPPTVIYQKDAPKGLKRLLKFARKAKADSHLTGWSSSSAFSEGDDDAEESKGHSSRFNVQNYQSIPEGHVSASMNTTKGRVYCNLRHESLGIEDEWQHVRYSLLVLRWCILISLAEYRRIIDGNLTLDSEGRPFRLLVFRGSPKSSRKSIRYIDELRRNDEEELNSINHPIIERKYSMREIRALDAPYIYDDFYQNLMDWGKKNILAVALGQAVYLWNAENRRIHRLMSSDTMFDLPISVSWSPNGKTLAVGHLKCSYIQLWDADTCKLTRRLEVDDAMVGAASWNGHILTSGNDKTILNHDVRARNSLVSRVYAHTSRVCGLKWSMSGNLLASGGDDNDVYIWEASRMNSSQFVHRFTHHVSAVKALAWCPYNFDVLASGGGVRDRCIKLWNTQKGTCITSVETGSQICGLEWNKNYKEIASGHGFSPNVNRNDLSLWKYPSMVKVGDIKGHAARVLQLSQSPDGLILVSAGADETIRFWDIFGPAPPPKRQSILSLNAFPIR